MCALVVQAQTINYGDLSGDSIWYQAITESSMTDSTPLYGTPSVAGDALMFNPPAFGASANGADGIDITDGTLTAVVKSLDDYRIEKLKFEEKGDYTLFGNGTQATAAAVNAALVVNVTEIEGVSVNPITLHANLTFSPSDGTYNLVDDGGIAVLWNGSIMVNVDQMIAAAGRSGQATMLDFSIDNVLTASSEAGTAASIQKKDVAGFSVTTYIPEPATLTLLLVSGLFLRRRA